MKVSKISNRCEAEFCFDDDSEVLNDLSFSSLAKNRFSYRIELSSEIHKKIKLFLTNYDGCIATNIVIFSDTGSYKIAETNGLEFQSGFVFLNKKPYIAMDLCGNESWIEVHANILAFDADMFTNIFTPMINAVQENNSLRRDRLNKLNKYEKLADINQSSQKYLQNMECTIRQLNMEIEHLKTDKEAILNSEAWKITKPLRKALDLLKTIKSKSTSGIVKSVSELKINSFSDICSKSEKKYEVILPEILKTYDLKKERKILLSTHELALTGAPVAILYFSQMLKENGFLPVLISPRHGRLEEDFKNSNIPVIIEEHLYSEALYLNYIQLFDAVIANTIVSAPIVKALAETKIPVLWWIHEAETSYKEPHFIEPMPQHIPSNVSVYVVGNYANKMMVKYKPLYSAKELLYYIPKVENITVGQYTFPENAKGKTVFCIVGLQEYRKGQDILIDAIFKLTQKELKESYFIFVGKKCYPPIYEKIEKIIQFAPDNISYIEELSRDEIYQLYEQIDCLICASRDDPMPIVAAEALQHGKMIICSENTGTASIVKYEKCGLVYRNNSSMELSEKIRKVLSDKTLLLNSTMCKDVYNKYFSKEVFTQNALKAIRDTMSLKKSLKHLMDKGTSLSIENMLEKLKKDKDTDPYTILNLDSLVNYDNTKRRNILLISHELSLTGAPIVLFTLAKTLKKIGINVVVLSPFEGPLGERIANANIPVIVYPHLYSNNYLQQFAECFDMIFANTVVTYRVIYQLEYCKVPIIWWIHDSEASYRVGGFRDCMISKLPDNVYVYCAGEYAQQKLLDYYPGYKNKAGILNYCVPDVVEEYKNDPKYPLSFDKKDRMLFAVIGQQDERKGHDILVQAIKELTEEQRKRAIFLFIGSHLDKCIENEVDALCDLYPENVYYIEYIEHRKIFSVYNQCDCIICCSKDDPMPVFITEAMMMGKIIICSENTGSASIIRQNQCGLLYDKNDPFLLKNQIVYVLNNYSKLDSMKAAARSTYLKIFNEESFEQTIKQLVEKYLSEKNSTIKFSGTVSVIIPTYNAGKQFEKLILSIMNQKAIKKVELTIVDSGSSDNTITLCKKYNVNFFQIANEDFTHSYARNLGAMRSMGDVFVFMTQDALPVDDYWLYNMIFPIISGEAVATSGREQCPDGTELFYRVATMGYAKFMGTTHNDQLNDYKGDETLDQLRRKASLTDIACAINAKVFKTMLYRYNYAEDLDMGVRLLKAGYRIKLLSGIRVIHGHNRNCGYYIRRSFVEQRAFGKIFSDFIEEKINSQIAALKIISACEAVYKTFNTMKCQKIRNCIREEYFGELITNLQTYSSNGAFIEYIPYSFDDAIFDKCIKVCQEICPKSTIVDGEIIHSLIAYVNNELMYYLGQNEVRFIDEKIAAEINDCVMKQLAILIGILLSKTQSDCEQILDLQSMMIGV